MKIEAVTTCVRYSDFLAHTITWNRHLFDRWIVVTSSRDRRTRDLCEHHHVECLQTDAFFAGERAFAKAAGINAGLERLDLDGWVAHLDADIVLPPRARQMLHVAQMDPEGIYGCDRMCCTSFEDWCRYVSWPEVMHSVNMFVQANDFPLGQRVGHLSDDGWKPIGFFQLWNPLYSKVRDYPDHGSADRSDLLFARRWPRLKRHLIPELVAIHLASVVENGMGANWNGRTTPHFGPEPAERDHLPEPVHHHHHHHHHHLADGSSTTTSNPTPPAGYAGERPPGTATE